MIDKISAKGWSMALTCVIIGLMLTMAIRHDESAIARNDPAAQVIERHDLAAISIDPLNEIDQLKVQAGLTALEGTGVTVQMDDSTKAAKSGENPNLYVIHDDDVLRVINELRAAGAEAIAINGQRLIDTSEIRCAGPTLSVNNVRSAAPFIISAIGDKQALENSIKMRGGVEQTLGVWGIGITVKASDRIYIPPFKGIRQRNFAQPVEERVVEIVK